MGVLMIPCNHNYELGRELRENDVSQERAEIDSQQLEYRVNELLQEGGSCHPWTMNNIFEALANMPLAAQFNVALKIGVAEDISHNKLAQEVCSETIRNEIRAYWQDVATEIARRM